MKKRILIGVVALIALVLIAGLIYFVFMYESDKKILNNLDDKISTIEKSINDNEDADDEISTSINEDIKEDTSSMDELEVSFDSVLNSLQEIESAEASLGTTVE